MGTFIFANYFLFAMSFIFIAFNGLDLKKWSSWAYALYGFLTGLSMYFINPSLHGSLQLGLMLAFMVIYGGAMMRWHRQLNKNRIASLLKKFEQADHPPLSVRIIKK
jgi:hypothetical protein